MIWCPNTNGICSELITPLPRTALYITDVNRGPHPNRVTIEKRIRSILRQNNIDVIFAPDYKKGSNILCKICKLIQQVSMGYLFYDRSARRQAIPNLFYETSLMHYLGKDIIMIGFKERRPSDLESIEWIQYENLNQVIRDFKSRLRTILDLKVFLSYADIEINSGNYLIGMEYLKKILLFNPNIEVLTKLRSTNELISQVETLKKEYHRNVHFIDTIDNWLRAH